MKNTVFIHTNAKQIIGAHVAAHALRRNSRNPDAFDVRIIKVEEFPVITARDGQTYLREGKTVLWENDNLQSFPPLRFAVPELMGYEGRAIVMDPDIFALGDINDLFEIDMKDAAVLARPMPAQNNYPAHFASSVMLLDCAKLKHWKIADDFAALFEKKRDYRDWMWLLTQPEGVVGPLDPVWNDFDNLTPQTRMLHNTNRRTQPWKTGLAVDFIATRTTPKARLKQFWRGLKAKLSGHGYAPNGFYKAHPDKAQEKLFFDLLQECIDLGTVTRADVEQEIARKHVRADAFQLLRA